MFVKEKQKIKVRMFFELMGWPKEALNKQLKKTVDHLRKTWKILKEDYAEPEKVGEKIFTTHVEFEAEVPNVHELFSVTLAFGPSIVEVIEPEEIILTANETQDILADISAKVTVMDKDIKILAAQVKKAKDVFQKLKKKPEKPKEAQNKEQEETPKITIEK